MNHPAGTQPDIPPGNPVHPPELHQVRHRFMVVTGQRAIICGRCLNVRHEHNHKDGECQDISWHRSHLLHVAVADPWSTPSSYVEIAVSGPSTTHCASGLRNNAPTKISKLAPSPASQKAHGQDYAAAPTLRWLGKCPYPPSYSWRISPGQLLHPRANTAGARLTTRASPKAPHQGCCY